MREVRALDRDRQLVQLLDDASEHPVEGAAAPVLVAVAEQGAVDGEQSRRDAEYQLLEVLVDGVRRCDSAQIGGQAIELEGQRSRVVAVDEQQLEHRIGARPRRVAAPRDAETCWRFFAC